jgi:hypothetical protein
VLDDIYFVQHDSFEPFTLNAFSTMVPILLAIVGYALDGELEGGENAKLNTARHAFSCSMRYAREAHALNQLRSSPFLFRQIS